MGIVWSEFTMEKSRRRQIKREAAKDTAAVQRYLVQQFEFPASADLNTLIVADASPLDPDDIEYVVEGFSDLYCIELPPVRAGSELEREAESYESRLNPINLYWQKLTSRFFPYHVDIGGITFGDLMKAAEAGVWPESRIRVTHPEKSARPLWVTRRLDR